MRRTVVGKQPFWHVGKRAKLVMDSNNKENHFEACAMLFEPLIIVYCFVFKLIFFLISGLHTC